MLHSNQLSHEELCKCVWRSVEHRKCFSFPHYLAGMCNWSEDIVQWWMALRNSWQSWRGSMTMCTSLLGRTVRAQTCIEESFSSFTLAAKRFSGKWGRSAQVCCSGSSRSSARVPLEVGNGLGGTDFVPATLRKGTHFCVNNSLESDLVAAYELYDQGDASIFRPAHC